MTEIDHIGGYHTDPSAAKWPCGSLWASEGERLYQLVREHRPAVIVETGTYHGCSASHLALACKHNGFGKVYSIDNQAQLGDKTGGMIPDDLREYVELIQADSTTFDFAARFPEGVDLLYEDGSHSPGTIRAVLARCPAKIVALHDYCHHLVGPAIVAESRAVLGEPDEIFLERPADCGLGIFYAKDGSAPAMVSESSSAIGKPIFVRLLNEAKEVYRSYSDLWKLIELSGFDTCADSEIDLTSNNTYIFYILNGDARHWAAQPGRKFRMVGWQLERRGKTEDADFTPSNFDSIWVSDRWLASQLTDCPNVKYVPVGGHTGLGGELASDRKFDLVPMAYLHGRRGEQVETLSHGYSIAPNAWGAERDTIISQSRAGLCLHQWPSDPVIESLRAVLFACWKLPLVFEFSHDYYPYEVYSLAEIPQALVDERGTVELNYELITGQLSFRNCVEAGLAQ